MQLTDGAYAEKSNAFRVALAIACLALVLACLSGCRVSDALTEVIYDQTADIIDYDNPTKIYVNDSTAPIESDRFAAKEVSDDAAVVSDTVQNLVVYSSNPNTDGFTAKKSVFDAHPDFKEIEASETVNFVKSDDPDAFDHAVTVEEPEEEEPEPEPEVAFVPMEQVPDNSVTTTTQSVAPTPSTSEGTSESDFEDVSGDDGGWEDPTPGEETGTETGEPDEGDPAETPDGGGNDDGDIETAYDAADPTAEPDKVNKVAAYGAVATIVQMVGGDGALAATDAETLQGNFARVFDTTNIARGWSDDGADSKNMDVDAIIESGANTVLVFSGTYLSSNLSKDDIKKLNDAGVTKTVIYPLTNSSNIKRDVRVIGEILSESTEIQYAGQTANRASDYASFHDRVVAAAAQASGGLAGTQVYQTGNDSAAPSLSQEGSHTLYTLLVDEFEDTEYVGSTRNGWKPASGLAFASAGYNSTPVSYYIQAGGLVNTAAAQTGKSDSGKVVAWQFNVNNFQFKKNEWSGATAEDAKTPSGFYSLLTTTNNLHGIYPFGESFGSASFPKLIAASSEIKSKIIANSQEENGMYHPYDFSTNGVVSMMGPNPTLPTCIGFNGADASQVTNLFENGAIEEASIVVNPRGLFSDWSEGTAESFLEAAWVNDVVTDSDDIGWAQEVANFYATFYGYSISDSDWEYMNPEGQ